jgi:Na+:H+ antiporter, NhaC family
MSRWHERSRGRRERPLGTGKVYPTHPVDAQRGDALASDHGDDDGREIPAWLAIVPVLVLIALLTLIILILPKRHPDFEGSGHLPLLASAAVAGLLARAHGHPWKKLQHGIEAAIGMAMNAILILVVIGMLIGTWLAGGVVPALIVWGLALLEPSYFLPTACAVCSVVALVSGSSWSTAGTVGLALIGIGSAMGIDPAMTAGAVVSGAYFGDKLSPLSDTTNLAPAMAGTDLFTHIRHMAYTTGPSWVVAMLLYTGLSLSMQVEPPTDSVNTIGQVIASHFEVGMLHVLPPVIVIVMVARRRPALPVLLLGAALGAIIAVAQGDSLASVLSAAMSGHTSHTGDPAVDELLSRGGMTSMSSTVLLILCAMAFGGVMECTGMLQTLARQLLRLARSTGSLVAVTVATAAGLNVVAADQYIAIIVPGRMYAAAFRDRGLHPKNLSRAVEDGGTITSPLVPWNTCGAFMSATLLVPTLAYAPFAFLCFLNPLLSILYGITGWTMTKLDDEREPPGATPPPEP